MAKYIQDICYKGKNTADSYMHNNHIMPNLGKGINERLGSTIRWKNLKAHIILHLSLNDAITEHMDGEFIFIQWIDVYNATTNPAFNDLFEINTGRIRQGDNRDDVSTVGCFIKLEHMDKFNIIRRIPWTLTGRSSYSPGINRLHIPINITQEIDGIETTFHPNALGGGIKDIKKNALIMYCVCNANINMSYEILYRGLLEYEDV